MRVALNSKMGDRPPILTLMPDNDYDRKTLRKLIDGYKIAGHGLHADSRIPLHVSLELEPNENPE